MAAYQPYFDPEYSSGVVVECQDGVSRAICPPNKTSTWKANPHFVARQAIIPYTCIPPTQNGGAIQSSQQAQRDRQEWLRYHQQWQQHWAHIRREAAEQKAAVERAAAERAEEEKRTTTREGSFPGEQTTVTLQPGEDKTLGIEITELSSNTGATKSMITHIHKESASHIPVGAIITGVNGNEVESSKMIETLREKSQSGPVTLALAPPQYQIVRLTKQKGFDVQKGNKISMNSNYVEKENKKMPLKDGDKILEVNKTKVESLEDVDAQIELELQEKPATVILVERIKKGMFGFGKGTPEQHAIDVHQTFGLELVDDLSEHDEDKTTGRLFIRARNHGSDTAKALKAHGSEKRQLMTVNGKLVHDMSVADVTAILNNVSMDAEFGLLPEQLQDEPQKYRSFPFQMFNSK